MLGEERGRALRHLRTSPGRLAEILARYVGGAPLGLGERRAARLFHDAMDENTLKPDALWWNVSGLDDLVNLYDRDVSGFGKAWAKVVVAALKLHISKPVSAIAGNEGIVHADGGLEQVWPAIEVTQLLT